MRTSEPLAMPVSEPESRSVRVVTPAALARSEWITVPGPRRPNQHTPDSEPDGQDQNVRFLRISEIMKEMPRFDVAGDCGNLKLRPYSESG
eukprot:585533-Rhodomonas_salina.1